MSFTRRNSDDSFACKLFHAKKAVLRFELH